ncbi:FUSC family protein [Pseudomonas sp. 5P_3.1_Bac2]|uniref:FUSC family protein n=1 Tax=Pseudomonas sp. 5P_3.1_Bac2 TaxID=2971617 RepID=UPI0021C7C6FF|nr:FUSC family protein [Pseudomonas sp. 5P_3.1_Bac2]MCU1719384.1 FUSC family protein [Pseudomonas sp. 5P_3.1_Bac2]
MQPLLNYFRLVFNPNLAVLLFALRTIAAALLTMYLSFIFDLAEPKWAMMAVIIVSQPLAGMALQRSFAQFIGTTVGAIVAVNIMALFPQAPLPFLITLALWLGFCTAGGTLLRYTNSQAFVLSGYTAVVVAMLAVPQQENTLMLAITRITETLLAVSCVALVSLLTARPGAVARGYFAKVDQVLKLMALHAAQVIRTEEGEAEFQQRQMQLLNEINVLEGLRRHLYFDAPRLRKANSMVQLLRNQLVLLTSRLTVLRHQRVLITERWLGDLPEAVQSLRADEVALLEQLAKHGRALPEAERQGFRDLRQRFEQLAEKAESLADPIPDHLRSLAWALRWEQARLLQQLDEVLQLSDAIQSGREASSVYPELRTNPLHMDYRLAGMNAVRAFVALMLGGLLWIETGWEGARGGLILIGVLCSLMATFPRPLMASQNYVRGFGLALVVAALYQFWLLPAMTTVEMLAVVLVPFLYVVAVGLSTPLTAGISMGLGLSTLLMVGPQNVGAWTNTAMQWFEFAGAYSLASLLALMVYALVFPFNPLRRMQRLYRESRQQVHELLLAPSADQYQFVFESRMADRLTMMLGLLPSISNPQGQRLYDVSLACMSLGVSLNLLKQQRAQLEPVFDNRLQQLLEQIGAMLSDQRRIDHLQLAHDLRDLGAQLDERHSVARANSHEQLWSLFRINVALLIVASFIERYSEFLQPLSSGESRLAH